MILFSLKSVFIVMLAVAFAIAAALQVLRHASMVSDGYNQQIVSVLLITFMEENTGKWPESWDMLEQIFKRDFSEMKPGIFDLLKSRVIVDFSADIQQMRIDSVASEVPPFCVVSSKFASGFHPIQEPNSSIQDYLKQRAAEFSVRADRKASGDSKGAGTVPE